VPSVRTKHILVKHTCGEGYAGSGISSAVMVSNPFCMHRSKVRVSKPWSVEWLYNIGLAHRIKQYIVEHNLALSKHAEIDMKSIAESKTIEHLDERVVCKLFGYETAEDYYTASSSMQFIPQIQTPSLFLIAEDDPFLGHLPIKVSSYVCSMHALPAAWNDVQTAMPYVVVQCVSACLWCMPEKPPRADRLSISCLS